MAVRIARRGEGRIPEDTANFERRWDSMSPAVRENDDRVRRFQHALGGPRKLLTACLLLLLEERSAHGYELLGRLEPFGFDRSNPGRIYRSLRWLEEAGFVQPEWETTAVGPARRVYVVSPVGRQALDESAAALRIQAKADGGAVGRYVLRRLRVLAGHKCEFQFVVEARVLVRAQNDSAARRKLERAFGEGRMVDVDVRTTGDVAIRDD